MKGESEKIYVKLSPENNEVLLSGIRFVDFIDCTPIPFENIMLLKADYIGERHCHNFSLLEGVEDITNFAIEGAYCYGDLCLVDYADGTSICQLPEEHIAELLYLAHMHKPLKSPFFESLQNNYAFLSHDDGWYCKLYCKQWHIPISMLCTKLTRSIQRAFGVEIISLTDSLVEKITELSARGLLIQLDISKSKCKQTKANKIATISLYEVGGYGNMDDLFNNLEQVKSKIAFETQLESQAGCGAILPL